MEISPLHFGLAWVGLLSSFLFFSFGVGMSILYLSHHCVQEAYNMFDIIDSQLERYLPQDESCLEFTHIWFKWSLDETLDLDFWVDGLRDGHEFWRPGAEYYRLNVCVPSNFLCWNLIPNVIVFGNGSFGGSLGRSWWASPHEWDECIYERDPGELPCPFYHVRL